MNIQPYSTITYKGLPMNRNTFSRRIRVRGDIFILDHTPNSLQTSPFHGYLDTDNLLMVTDLSLHIGSIIHGQRSPEVKYLVTNCNYTKYYDEYSTLMINCESTLSRFSKTNPTDTFGRSSVELPELLIEKLPLHLLNSIGGADHLKNSPRPDNPKSVIYELLTSSSFDLHINDRLTFSSNITLVITDFLLDVHGLCRFRAVAT